MFDSVAHQNKADASHSDAEYEKCKAKTKKLEEEALSLELDNKDLFLLKYLKLGQQGIPENEVNALFPVESNM